MYIYITSLTLMIINVQNTWIFTSNDWAKALVRHFFLDEFSYFSTLNWEIYTQIMAILIGTHALKRRNTSVFWMPKLSDKAQLVVFRQFENL